MCGLSAPVFFAHTIVRTSHGTCDMSLNNTHRERLTWDLASSRAAVHENILFALPVVVAVLCSAMLIAIALAV